MKRSLLAAAAAALLRTTAVAQAPAAYSIREVATNGTTLYVRTIGSGPAVILLHGFGDTGDMWEPLARDLARDHLVIVPDLRGFGLSAHPAGGYDKRTQGRDIAGLLDALHVGKVDVAGHDIGNMVSYSFTAQYPSRVRRLVLMDAPVPGLGAAWDWLKANPSTWHFGFHGPDMERLVAGRERIYLDRFYNELSAHPERIGEETRAHYAALYARPGNMHAAFEQFAAFGQDESDDRALAAKGRLTMPVLAIGGEKSMGDRMAESARFFADTVRSEVVPDAGHWLMEERPDAVVPLIAGFLRG